MSGVEVLEKIPLKAGGPQAIEEIFADASRDRMVAARKTLALLEAGGWQLRRGRFITFITSAGICATLPSCSRTKVIPASGPAGAIVSVAVSPEKRPRPSNETSRATVF